MPTRLLKLNNVITIRERLAMLKDENAQLKDQLQRDSFTGLYNKDYINRRINDSKGLNSVIVADIDFFKKVNDTYGHIAGDEVLKKVSEIIKSTIRQEDIASRFGGEEFVILCPGAVVTDAVNIAERIRENIEKIALEIDGKKIRVTMSFGVAELKDNSSELLEAADKALYKAKNCGRNRVEYFKITA